MIVFAVSSERWHYKYNYTFTYNAYFMLFSSMDDPSAEIASVQKRKASFFAKSLDMHYEQQAQLLTYTGVTLDDSILLPES